MVVFIYDGSFEGLLTSVFESYYASQKPDKIISRYEYEQNFLNTCIDIITDTQKAQKVTYAIKSKISDMTLEYAYSAYLSELPGISDEIYRYIRLGFKIGKDINKYLTESTVMSVHKASLKVTNENHRYVGLLRFKRLRSDIYYASIEPDHNILAMLSEHFKDRLSDQKWVIHDIKRNLASIYDTKRWFIETIYNQGTASLNPFIIKDADSDFEALWKLYFKHIAIEARRNIKLQKQHMPARYWYHLTEKKF